MAIVIQSPAKGSNRRALPAGLEGSLVLEEEMMTKENKSTVSEMETGGPAKESQPNKQVITDAPDKSEELDINYIERLHAERDKALALAQEATESLRLLQEQSQEQLQQQLQETRDKAKEQGYQEGLEYGKQLMEKEQGEGIASLKALLTKLSDQHLTLIRQAENAAVEIGFAAALKLVGRVNTDPSLLASLVKQSLEQVLEREGLVVFLRSESYQQMRRLQETRDSKGKDQSDWADVLFKVDDSIQMGGCRIESRSGSLDARLELQVDTLKNLLVRTSSGRSLEAEG